MTEDTPYAIGTADSIGLVVANGIWTIEYDLKQVQDEGYVKYDVPELERDEYYETDEMDLGDNISLTVAEHAVDELGVVYGFIVPDYLLGTFIEHFPDKEVYRQHG